jgi:lysophospholipase L1-like esterase
MKPIKISAFLVVILTVVLLIPYLFSTSSFSILNYTFRLPGKTLVKQHTPLQYKDISDIKTLLQDTSGMSPDSLANNSKKKLSLVTQTQAIKKTYKKDSLKNIIQSLEFPPERDELLDPFFSILSQLTQSSQLIRILHYGDSQIEADRITSYFRNQMQREFGGGGVGFIPITPVNPASISYVFETSPNWSRYTILNTHKKDNEPDYGILGNFSRFTSRNQIQDVESEAWVLLKNPNITYSNASKFNRCKLMFSGNRAPLFIQLKKEETIIDADIFPSEQNIKIVDWEVETGARNLLVTMKGKDSPDLYGISLDNNKGIAVDNIPLRGSSGLEFTRIYKSPYHKILDKLNVKLIILQFGVNAVINMSANIPRYEKAFLKQLLLIRQSQPGIPVIVIGVSDISKNTPEGYVTNNAVEKIRDAQKRAAFEAGCVFWDMYEGMGGKNSMPSWVFAQPSLAQKDFIHLNPLGARIIGEMFFRSLMKEYNKYLQKKNLE